jgi:hypothetical protein
MRKIILSLLICTSAITYAQDSLPAFSVVNKGNNRVVISWNNKFPQLKQISIQRSTDSLSNFKSLITVPILIINKTVTLTQKRRMIKCFTGFIF